MHSAIREKIVSRLRALVDLQPQQAMDELERQRRNSVCEWRGPCAFTLRSRRSGHDWHHSAAMEIGQPRTRTISGHLSKGSFHGLVSCALWGGRRWFRNAIHHLLAILLQARVDTPRREGSAHRNLDLMKFVLERALARKEKLEGMVGATGFEPVTSTV